MKKIKRMTEQQGIELLNSFSGRLDIQNIPLDDEKTYSLFEKADTDGIYMLESNWDKYDLLQIKPKNFDELVATMAFSHGQAVNPYIYTYLKIEHVKPFTFPRLSEIQEIKEMLKDSRGMLLYKEQKEDILTFLNSVSDEFKEEHKVTIRVLLREIKLRQHSLSNRTFFRQRAAFSYKLAYIKAHYWEEFECFRLLKEIG